MHYTLHTYIWIGGYWIVIVVDVFWDEYVFVLHGLYQRIIPISIYALFIACTLYSVHFVEGADYVYLL